MAENDSWLYQGRQEHGWFGSGTSGRNSPIAQSVSRKYKSSHAWRRVYRQNSNQGSGPISSSSPSLESHAEQYNAQDAQTHRPSGSTGNLSPDQRPVKTVATEGPPGNNQAQNAQIQSVVRILRLTPSQRQQLHREIYGQNYGFHEIMQIARDMFGK